MAKIVNYKKSVDSSGNVTYTNYYDSGVVKKYTVSGGGSSTGRGKQTQVLTQVETRTPTQTQTQTKTVEQVQQAPPRDYVAEYKRGELTTAQLSSLLKGDAVQAYKTGAISTKELAQSIQTYRNTNPDAVIEDFKKGKKTVSETVPFIKQKQAELRTEQKRESLLRQEKKTKEAEFGKQLVSKGKDVPLLSPALVGAGLLITGTRTVDIGAESGFRKIGVTPENIGEFFAPIERFEKEKLGVVRYTPVGYLSERITGNQFTLTGVVKGGLQYSVGNVGEITALYGAGSAFGAVAKATISTRGIYFGSKFVPAKSTFSFLNSKAFSTTSKVVYGGLLTKTAVTKGDEALGADLVRGGAFILGTKVGSIRNPTGSVLKTSDKATLIQEQAYTRQEVNQLWGKQGARLYDKYAFPTPSTVNKVSIGGKWSYSIESPTLIRVKVTQPIEYGEISGYKNVNIRQGLAVNKEKELQTFLEKTDKFVSNPTPSESFKPTIQQRLGYAPSDKLAMQTVTPKQDNIIIAKNKYGTMTIKAPTSTKDVVQYKLTEFPDEYGNWRLTESEHYYDKVFTFTTRTKVSKQFGDVTTISMRKREVAKVATGVLTGQNYKNYPSNFNIDNPLFTSNTPTIYGGKDFVGATKSPIQVFDKGTTIAPPLIGQRVDNDSVYVPIVDVKREFVYATGSDSKINTDISYTYNIKRIQSQGQSQIQNQDQSRFTGLSTSSVSVQEFVPSVPLVPETPTTQTPTTPSLIPIPLEPIRGGGFTFPEFKKETPRFGSGFATFVRKKGQFVRVNTKPLTKSSAIGLGIKLTGETSLASFKIRPIGGKGVQNRKYEGFLGQLYRYRKPIRKKSELKDSDIWIEKNKYRINTAGEFSEISLKGARKRRRVY